MASKRVLLDTAEFLDSAEAAELSGVPSGAVRGLAEAFAGACHEDLGQPPEQLDGEGVRTVLTALLPRRLAAGDPRADHAPAVLDAYLRHLETHRVFPGVFEARLALENALPEFQRVVRGGDLARQVAQPVDPFIHGAPKLGRNDPCSCGSGKKFKKCHGRGQ